MSVWDPNIKIQPPGQGTNGLTNLEIYHEPCLPAIL